MKRYISILMAMCMVFILPVQAQARLLKLQYEHPKTSEKNRASAEVGVKIGSKTVNFKEFTLVGGRVSAMLPENAKLDPQYEEVQYVPYRNLTFVSVNDELFINFNMTYHFDPEEYTLQMVMQEYREIADPSKTGSIRSEKLATEISWMDWGDERVKNPIIGDITKKNPIVPVYGLGAALEVDGVMCLVEFYCPMEYLDKYEKTIQAILATIKECEVK